jgi:hypothetical protein
MYQARFQTLDLSQHICSKCGFFRISQGRYELLKKMRETTSPNQRMLCLPCGDAEAHKESKRKATMVQPINKSTPTYISDPTMLKMLNPKRTT